MDLSELVSDFADALVTVDRSGKNFRSFRSGVGPYGEPQLVKLVVARLNELERYGGSVQTRRSPDFLIPNDWAIEVKLCRPFGDNGKEAENWSVNVLHPYLGNVSTIGDCLKLLQYSGPERRAVLIVGYEHVPIKIDLLPVIKSFEAIANHVFRMRLSKRIEACRKDLVHPIHQALRVFAWEVLALEDPAI